VLQPAPGNLQALTMSTGGTALPDAQAVKIATIVGATGGLIPQNDSGIYPGAAANAYGAFAGWTISTANYTSVTGGHPAALLTFNNGQLVSNYLYRNAVPGQPQLNQMNTALDMQGNNVNNVGQVNTATLAATGNATVGGTLGVTGTATSAKVALTDTVVEGAACGAVNGLVSKDASGLLLSCQSGVWLSQTGALHSAYSAALIAGTYNLAAVVPAAAKTVVIFSCVGSGGTNYMGGFPIIGTGGVAPVCASAQVPNGVQVFSGTGWFQVIGYVL
jgi:hypothetical protein